MKFLGPDDLTWRGDKLCRDPPVDWRRSGLKISGHVAGAAVGWQPQRHGEPCPCQGRSRLHRAPNAPLTSKLKGKDSPSGGPTDDLRAAPMSDTGSDDLQEAA
jgi:hypothetical protein